MTSEASANPPETELGDAVRVGWGLVRALWCVRDTLDTDEKVSDRVTSLDPPGTSLNQWVVCDDQSQGGPCPDYPNRRHVVVNC